MIKELYKEYGKLFEFVLIVMLYYYLYTNSYYSLGLGLLLIGILYQLNTLVEIKLEEHKYKEPTGDDEDYKRY